MSLRQHLTYTVFLLVLLAAAGMASAQIAQEPTPTLQGPVVPTRVLPTDTRTVTNTPIPVSTDTPEPSQTPTNTETATQTATETLAPTSTVALTPTNTAAPTVEVAEMSGLSIASQISVDTPARGFIDNNAPALLYVFSGAAGDLVNITMTGSSGNLDTFLLLLDGAGRELARNDDRTAQDRNAAISSVQLPADGTYMIVASRYQQRYGNSSGDFVLLLTAGEIGNTPTATTQPITYDGLETGTISSTTYEQFYTFEGTEGDLVTIQASATSGNLDPSITLTDSLANIIARNDDDIANDTINSQLRSIQLPASGFYTIVVSRYQGVAGASAGDYRLKLALDSAGTPGSVNPRYAILNVMQSGSVDSNSNLYVDYLVGDQNNDDGEFEFQALLTFELPSLPQDANFTARFDFGACLDRGGGMTAIGSITLYDDPFGEFVNSSGLSRPSNHAGAITSTTDCAPIDVTDVVRDAYASGAAEIQFRVRAETTIDNSQTDAVAITDPRLYLTLEGTGAS